MQTNNILVVDLDNGSYVTQLKWIGHEFYNLVKNIDGNFYGIVPPGNLRVCIERIDKKVKPKDYIDDVLVVYVRKVSSKCNDRSIIAFCENARVYRDFQSGNGMNREILQPDGTVEIANWHIKSDNLTNLQGVSSKHIIPIGKQTKYGNTSKLFRGQRSYLDSCDPRIKIDILNYLSNYKNVLAVDYDLGDDQEAIQNAPISSLSIPPVKDEKHSTSKGVAIKKNSARAKWVLNNSGYKCLCDNSHHTFNTNKNNPYMEGHHLIPCTIANSEYIDKLYNSPIDREENIVCICPNCHRAIHFGDKKTKDQIIGDLYNKQIATLKSIGINISLSDLLKLY